MEKNAVEQSKPLWKNKKGSMIKIQSNITSHLSK